MSTQKSFLERLFPTRADGAAAPRAVPPDPQPQPVKRAEPLKSFSVFGERGEQVSEQIAQVLSRLTDLQRLRDDFAAVAEPMNDFIVSHAEAQTRLAEAEALLSRERQETQTLRATASSLRYAAAQTDGELADLQSRHRNSQETAQRLESELQNTAIRADNLVSQLELANRKLSSEAGRAQGLADANTALSATLHEAEENLAGERARALETRDAAAKAESEIRRLNELVDRLQPVVTQSKRSIRELENSLASSQLAIGTLELKVAADAEARDALERKAAGEKGALENELAMLGNEIEALTDRNATTTRLLEQARTLVNQKTDEARVSDRTARDASTGRIAAEQAHAAARHDVERLTRHAAENERGVAEAQERCAMLGKAIVAKDQQIEQLLARIASVTKQMDLNAQRYSEERADLEATNRRLIEETESEKAERALAQGALSIARASREKLLGQIDDMKRGRVSADGDEADRHGSERSEGGDGTAHTNVRIFRTPDNSVDIVRP